MKHLFIMFKLRKVRNFLTSAELILHNAQMPAEKKIRLLEEELHELDGR